MCRTFNSFDCGCVFERAQQHLTSYNIISLAVPHVQTAAVEVEETIKRIASHKGVEGIMVANYEGVTLRSTLSAALSAKYAGLFAQLISKARSNVRTIDADVSASVMRGSLCVYVFGWIARLDSLIVGVATRSHFV